MPYTVHINKEAVLGLKGIAIVKRISNIEVFENGKPTGAIEGAKISVVVPEKNFEEISVRIENHLANEYPSNDEIEEAARNFDFYAATFEDFDASITLYDDYNSKFKSKRATPKNTASDVVISKLDKSIDLFGGEI